MAYETYVRVVLPGASLSRAYTLLCLLCVASSLWRCVTRDAHMHLAPAELVTPYIVASGGGWHNCSAEALAALKDVRAGVGAVSCLHWDGLEAVESAGPTVFIATAAVDVQQAPCPEGGCHGGNALWELESQSAGLVAAPETFMLKVAHSFRTPLGSGVDLSGNARQMAGKLVRYHRAADAEASQSVHQHDPAAYDVLASWPAHSGRVTRVSLALLLLAAGVDLDAPALDGTGGNREAPRCPTNGTNACLRMGRRVRGCGIALELHIVYSNLWHTSADLLRPTGWLWPAAEPSYLIHVRPLPLHEASRVESRPLANGSRVVTTRFGVKVNVLCSGVLGSVTADSMWSFVVQTIIGLGIAWTATEALLSLAALPPRSRLRQLADFMCGGARQAEALCGTLYRSGGAPRRRGRAHSKEG